MSIASKAVAIANKVTLSLDLQVKGSNKVILKSFAGDGGVGDPTYNPPAGKKYSAVIEKRQRQVRGFDGQMTVSHTSVMFLDPAIRVKAHDVILLSDGSGGEVIGLSSPIDNSGVLLTEAYL